MSLSPTSRQTRRSENYYFNSGDLFILVQEVYFRVHRYFFERESSTFVEFFAEQGFNGDRKTAHRNPLKVDGITPEQFEKLLWVFYNPVYSIYDAPLEDWIVILDLASTWSFAEVRALALRELEKIDMDLVPRIALYQRHRVDPATMVPLYAELCERAEMLTMPEADALGMETAIRVFRARELLRNGAVSRSSGMTSPLPTGIEPWQVQDVVLDVFGIETRPANGEADPGNS